MFAILGPGFDLAEAVEPLGKGFEPRGHVLDNQAPGALEGITVRTAVRAWTLPVECRWQILSVFAMAVVTTDFEVIGP
jgi:hypothetical protein